MRRRVAAAGVVAALFVAWWALSGIERDGTPVRYVEHTVDRGPIVSIVTATGTVNPVGAVEVGTYVSGPIQAIDVDFNSPIRRGDRLAKIDPRPFQVKVDAAAAALANARARLVKARAALDLKAATLRRHRDLHRTGVVATSELDVAVSDHRQAAAQVALDEAEVAAAAARLDEAGVNLAYTDIVAPIDGVVVSRNVSVGQTVAATFQTPTLFVVAGDLTRMRVVASVSESDIGGVAEEQTATFTVDAHPTITFRGRVTQVRSAPVTVLNVVTYEVLIDVDNPELLLKPGMTANVAITTAAVADAVRIPTSALRFRPPDGGGTPPSRASREDGPLVWRLDADGVPTPVPVAVGVADEQFTEATSGIHAGDRVVVGLETPDDPSGERSRAPSLPVGMRRVR